MRVFKNSKLNAFTLVEVLITLTIIGIIAALTIPNLLQSYRKHQVEVGVKEAYSILSNAIKISEVENGPANEWDTTTNPDIFAEKYLFPYLKIAKKCKFNVIDTCFPVENGAYYFKHLNGDNVAYVPYWPYKTSILSNGMAIAIWSGRAHSFNIAVDIDGPNKGKSISGKDVFFFTYNSGYGGWHRHGNEFFLPGYISNYTHDNPQNYSLEELLGTSLWGSCNKNGKDKNEITQASLCGLAIMKNGWKIPDDYPVKKW